MTEVHTYSSFVGSLPPMKSVRSKEEDREEEKEEVLENERVMKFSRQ